MIIYGSRSVKQAVEQLSDPCPHCGTANSTELYVFQKYAHVFWIPFFPIGKTAVSQCNHCKQILKKNEMPSSMLHAYDRIKAKTRVPVWTFAGLALVGVLITAGFVTDKQKDEKNAKLIQAPAAGDVFEVRTKEGQYTLMKIAEVKGDSLFIQLHQYETNKIKGLRDLRQKGESAFSEDMFVLLKADVQAMLKDGEILDIERK
jgi:zinc-ribbon family